MRIGIYRPQDPLLTIPSLRLHALLNEAEKRQIELFFFEQSGIHLETATVEATYWGEQHTRTVPYPDVVLNEWPGLTMNRTDVENQLRIQVPFTSHLIHDNLQLYKLLEFKYAEHLLPYASVHTWEQILMFIKTHHDVILKPVNGRNRQHIYRIRLEAERFAFQEQTLEYMLTLAELKLRVEELLAARPYFVQQYWPVLTDRNEHFDFRIYVQRSSDGRFQITKLYPRIGTRHAISSHLHNGVPSSDLKSFMAMWYPQQSSVRRMQLEQFSLQIAEKINGFYPFLIDELSIDLLMQRNGDIRFLEASSGPETRHHEQERAIHTIGYAVYLAEVVHRKSPSETPFIGMLLSNATDDSLREASAFAASHRDGQFYYFHPQDMINHFQVIKGHCMNKGVWESRYFPYPDVVYDRLRGKGTTQYNHVYTQLKNALFTE